MNSASSRRILSLLFIAAIAVVFTLQFGPGSRGCEAQQDGVTGASGPAAVVNGREIPTQELARNYQFQLQRFQGQNIPTELLRQLVPPRQVLDAMIDAELFAQAGEQRGVVASDAELAERIRAMPSFQNQEGRFDPDVYRRTVRDFLGKSVADYEAELRRSLTAQKMEGIVEQAATVSDDEVKARFLKEGNTANLTYVRFLPAMFADKVAAPTPAQLATFRKEHEEAVKAQYEQTKYLYTTPEQVNGEEKKPAETKPFEQVADDIARQLYTKQQAQTLARGAADRALAQLQKGKGLKEAFPAPKEAAQGSSGLETEKQPQARESGAFNASQESVPGLVASPDLMRDIFSSEGPRSLPQVYAAGDGFVVAAVTERKRPGDADFEQQKEALRAQARQAKQYELRDAFLKELRKSGNVKVNDDALAQVAGS